MLFTHLLTEPRCRSASALVPVYKRMISDNMEKVSRRHFKKIGMQIGIPNTGLRQGNSRLQEA